MVGYSNYLRRKYCSRAMTWVSARLAHGRVGAEKQIGKQALVDRELRMAVVGWTIEEEV